MGTLAGELYLTTRKLCSSQETGVGQSINKQGVDETH